MGRLNTGVSASSSITTAPPRYSANQLIGAPRTGPTISATSPQPDRHQGGHYCRAAAQHHPGGDKAERPGRRDQHRLEHLAELGDAEVELDLEHRKADDDAAEAQVSDAFQEDAVLGASSPIARSPSYSSSSAAMVENPAPPIIIRWVGPHRVTSWPKMRARRRRVETGQRVKPAAGHQNAADRRIPVFGDPYRKRAGLLVGQDDRRAAGDERRNRPTRMK